MEISFLLPNLKKVNSPYDFGIYKDKYSFIYFLQLKGLEFREDFVERVEAFRKENHIDEVFLFERLFLPTIKTIKESNANKAKSFSYSDGIFIDMLEHVFSVIMNQSFLSLVAKINILFSDLDISQSGERFRVNYYAIAEIVLFGVVRVKNGLPPIYWLPHSSDVGLSTIGIYIGSDISKQQLKRYIDQVYEKEIRPAFVKNQMQRNSKIIITERDFFVLHSRIKERMKFKTIAELLEKSNMDFDTNEDMVKKIFNRAMVKIKSI